MLLTISPTLRRRIHVRHKERIPGVSRVGSRDSQAGIRTTPPLEKHPLPRFNESLQPLANREEIPGCDADTRPL